MEHTKVPELRFRQDDGTEFSAWKQQAFNCLYERNSERNKIGIPYDKTISIAKMQYNQEGNGASPDSLGTYKVLRIGDIAYEGHTNKKFQYGRFVLNDIGDGIISPRFMALRPINQFPVSFWKNYIHREATMNRVLVHSTKQGTMMNELVVPEFLKQTIYIPPVPEQQKIGDFFTALDHRIALADKKLVTLQTIKKGMLQKIFSQELRFKDDDGNEFPAWNTKCLDDIYSFQNGLNAGKEQFGRGIKLISVSEVLDNRPIQYNAIRSMVALDEKEAKRFSVKYGDILFQRSSETREDAGKCNVYLDTSNEAVFGGFVIRARAKIKCIPLFMNTLLKSNTVRKQVVRMAQGAQHVNVGQENLSAIQVSLPSLSEQQKIADYFTTLDNSIDATQRKTDTLRLIKKGLLQKMFV